MTMPIWGGVTLRGLSDRKGQELIDGVLEIADRMKPLHLSLVGGDPLVRYREVEAMVPLLLQRGIHVQVVTSAFRPMHESWGKLDGLAVVVSIDGLQPDHDARRAPATYERILKNIEGQRITIHGTITGQMMKRPGYLREFLEFWTPRPEIKRVWFSIFTPQVGDQMPEILTPAERQQAIADLVELRQAFPKLDMPEALIRQFAAAAPAGRVRVRFDDAGVFGGPEDEGDALPVRGQAGLRAVRLYRLDGAGGDCRSQVGWGGAGGGDLQAIDPHWQVVVRRRRKRRGDRATPEDSAQRARAALEHRWPDFYFGHDGARV